MRFLLNAESTTVHLSVFDGGWEYCVSRTHGFSFGGGGLREALEDAVRPLHPINHSKSGEAIEEEKSIVHELLFHKGDVTVNGEEILRLLKAECIVEIVVSDGKADIVDPEREIINCLQRMLAEDDRISRWKTLATLRYAEGRALP